MNRHTYYKQLNQMKAAQSAYDAQMPPDDERIDDEEYEPDFEAMIEARELNRQEDP